MRVNPTDTMYECNSDSIAGLINGSRFFVLKTKWMRMENRDCGIGDSSFWLFRAFSACGLEITLRSWGDAPGFYITRPWRFGQSNTICKKDVTRPYLIV